jgi:Domain of unknown function (DUF202)
MPPIDSPGLQSERTTLAWSRTTLSALALAGLLLKAGLSRHDFADFLGCGLAFATALSLQVARLVRHAEPGRPPSAPASLMRAISACCVVAMVASTASVLTSLM